MRYYDGCPTAHALDLIGERWALLIVRELLLGPKRFTDLMRGLPRVSRNVLTQRLSDLDEAGVLVRRRMPPPASTAVYELTPRGLQLESVLQALGRWGAASPTLPPRETVGVDTFVLGLRGSYDADRDPGTTPARFEVRVADEAFDFLFGGAGLSVRRGGSPDPAPVIEVNPHAMAGVASGELPLLEALSPAGAGPGDDACRAFAERFPAASGDRGPSRGPARHRTPAERTRRSRQRDAPREDQGPASRAR